MKRLLGLAAWLYPAAWRDRYGVEFRALLDDTDPRWRIIVDVLIGGLQMRLRSLHPALTVVAFSVIGALAAAAIAYNIVDRFASTGTMNVRPPVPLQASDTAWLQDRMPRLAHDAFSREFLARIIRKHGLYLQRGQSSTDDLVNRMRGDIRIQLLSRSLVQVSFAAADARQAQEVTGDLMALLVDANFATNGESVVQMIDLPDEPRPSVSPRRIAVAGVGGTGVGALLGALITIRRRRPSQPAS
jgi:hypothetical protein